MVELEEEGPRRRCVCRRGSRRVCARQAAAARRCFCGFLSFFFVVDVPGFFDLDLVDPVAAGAAVVAADADPAGALRRLCPARRLDRGVSGCRGCRGLGARRSRGKRRRRRISLAFLFVLIRKIRGSNIRRLDIRAGRAHSLYQRIRMSGFEERQRLCWGKSEARKHQGISSASPCLQKFCASWRIC